VHNNITIISWYDETTNSLQCTAVKISSAVIRIYDYKILTISSNLNADADTAAGALRYILTLSYGKLELSPVFDLRLPHRRWSENQFLDALVPVLGKN